MMFKKDHIIYNEHNNIMKRNHQIISINDTNKRIKRNSVVINDNLKKEKEKKDLKKTKKKK